MPLVRLVVCLAALLGSALPLVVPAEGAPLTLDQLKAARRSAAERPRRVIFNNDGNEPVYLCKDTTPEELLRHRTAALAGTHVDSIFYCTWSGGLDLFTHTTKVGHNFVTKEGRFSTNMTDKLLAAGTDPLKVMVDFGKQHKIEVFWSFRLNDTHDAAREDYGPIMWRANPFKLAHQDWLIGSAKELPKFGGWTAVDYARPEIRDHAVELAAEVCQNFDVDGIELDFFRHPVFFRRHAQTGTPCNDEERAQMTEFVQRVRAATEAAGLKRGRPILVAMRVPDSASYCRDIGIDLERWLKEGLLDLMVVAGYFQLNPWETSVALGHKHGVKVYPSLDESRVQDPAAKKLRMSVAAYRGRALNVWRSGADGIYLFNSFDPKNPIWHELGAPDKLAAFDQDYFASVRGVGGAAGNALPHRTYQKIPTLNPKSPLVVSAKEPAATTITIGAVPAMNRAGDPAEFMLRLQFKELASPQAVHVTLNGRPLQGGSLADGWLAFSLFDCAVTTGENKVAVALAGGEKNAATKLEWTDLRCSIRWPEAPAK